MVKLWLIVGVVVGCCLYTLANSTPKCGITPGGAIAAECVGTSMAHGLAPYLPWVIVVMVGLAVLATLRFALRRR